MITLESRVHQTGSSSDTQMRCAAFTNVPTNYYGVELGAFALTTTTAAGTSNTTVSGTASSGKCGVPSSQLVRLDALADPTSSLCNNSSALVAGCTGYQGPFVSGQFYTQPVVSYGTMAVAGNTLYAVPFFSPANGGPITKLGVNVTSVGASPQCEVGVYNAFAGVPTTLIADGGTLSITGVGAIVTSGTFSAPVQLAPQTLYFLAVGCSGATTLTAAGAGNSLSASVAGSLTFANSSSNISTGWSFSALHLPSPFGAITRATAAIPNVFAGP